MAANNTAKPPSVSVPDIEGLKAYIVDGDRQAPVRFAGRAREIETILALAGRARHGKVGLTHVISAAPGAGKTALLREVAARCTTQGVARPVYLQAKTFSNPANVIQALLEDVDPEAAERLGLVETRTQGSSVGAEAGAAVPGLKAGVQGESHESIARQRKTLPTDFEEAFELLADKKTPIVLLVDEAQAWEGDLPSGRSGLLMDAHVNRKRLPLLIIAAGLGNAPAAVAKRGASKLKTEEGLLVLGALSEDEMREVCSAFFDHYGITGSEARRAEWTEALITGTDGWPRHLTNVLRGAATQLAKAGGDLEKASLKEALQSASRFRRQYYDDQLSPFEGMPELLTEVFTAMPRGGGSKAKVENAIDDAYDAFPRLERRMPCTEVFKNLLHQGLIQKMRPGRYDCPIPSLRSAVEALCAEEGSPVAGNEDDEQQNLPEPELI